MTLIKAVKLILTLRCEDSIRFMSAARDEKISRVELWAFRLHLIGCVPCRRFRKQIRFIHKAAKRLGTGDAAKATVDKLSVEVRERILRDIHSSDSNCDPE